MEEIRIFNNPEFGEVRTILIDGEPWFVGKDVANALGYKKVTEALQTNVDEMDSTLMGVMDSMGREQKTKVINESGLYSLIFGSKLDSAKKFKRWVTSEVLPSLRKTGSYGAPKTIPEQIQLLAQGNVELNQRVDTLTERIDKIELDLPLLPIEADGVSNAVKHRVVEALGGKGSNAYHNKSISQTAFIDAYRNLKRNFNVSSYKAIKRNQYNRAIEIVNGWNPPVFLADEIEACNSQMRLDI